MKFKKGDRVAMTDGKHIFHYATTKAGWTGTVIHVEGSWVDVLWDQHHKALNAETEDIELEAVYNSPLYKALR